MNEDIVTGIFDEEELHTNCTVQIWRNSETGAESVGWWDNDRPDKINYIQKE